VKETGSALPRFLVAGLIVIAAGATGFIVHQKAGESQVASPLAPVADTAGSADSADPQDGTEPISAPKPEKKSVPTTLPDITLADPDGKPTALASFAGRPLLVNFWATWCAPCRREIPLLNRIRAERKAQNAEIVGIAVDFPDKVLEFTKTTRIDYPLLIGEEDGLAAAEAFGMGMGFPFSVFVDSQNRILTIKIGELHEDEANFAFDRIRDLDAGILTLDAAQAQLNEAFRQMAVDRAKAAATAGQSHTD
jgi:thiol-disulfide isomerase/thioredoxin